MRGRRKYDREFKEGAVRLVGDGGKSARDWGINENIQHRRIARLMRENRIKARIKKRFKVTTQSDHSLPIVADLLGRDFYAQGPNEKWLSDITDIWTWEGWMYLAVVMDVSNREIVGWIFDDRIKKELVADSLRMALLKRDPEPGLIFHSDRGS